MNGDRYPEGVNTGETLTRGASRTTVNNTRALSQTLTFVHVSTRRCCRSFLLLVISDIVSRLFLGQLCFQVKTM